LSIRQVICRYGSAPCKWQIREAQLQKTPYMLILGDKEVQNNKVSVRLNKGNVLEGFDIQDFTSGILREISERKLASVFASSATNMNQEVNNSSI
jgi:threonyl-tRNA synthetase